MSPIRLSIDEDSMRQSFLQALRARGAEVRTAYEDGMLGRSDEEQLRRAAAQRRVLYTYNVADFYRLHAAFLGRGENHSGSSWCNSDGTHLATSCRACSG